MRYLCISKLKDQRHDAPDLLDIRPDRKSRNALIQQRLETLSGIAMTEHKLKKLNKDLDDLYELLYDRINTISEAEVRSISPLLSELVKSVKALYTVCRKSDSKLAGGKETERLGMNYSAIQELFSDLQNFRLSSEEDKELKALLSQGATLMQRIS